MYTVWCCNDGGGRKQLWWFVGPQLLSWERSQGAKPRWTSGLTKQKLWERKKHTASVGVWTRDRKCKLPCYKQFPLKCKLPNLNIGHIWHPAVFTCCFKTFSLNTSHDVPGKGSSKMWKHELSVQVCSRLLQRKFVSRSISTICASKHMK